MYLSGQAIVEIAKWLSAAGAVSGAFFAVFKFLEREKHQQAEIAAIKREQSVMCYGILACLKGLKWAGDRGAAYIGEASESVGAWAGGNMRRTGESGADRKEREK